jgi:hypothetical protein
VEDQSEMTVDKEESKEFTSDPRYDELPIDIILRPPAFHVPGVSSAPSGWKVRIPPFVFQIFKNYGYAVAVRHKPGQQYILLDWKLQPPTWEEIIEQENFFPESERQKLNNDEVKQQVCFSLLMSSYIIHCYLLISRS